MEFLANENFPLASIKLLREAGYKVYSIAKESPGEKDIEILKRAYNESLIILTFDRDYGELVYKHKNYKPKAIAYFRFHPSYPEEAGEILLSLLKSNIVSMESCFNVIEKSRIRQRSI